MEGFERGTQGESCDITHMGKTEDNTENLKKQNNHIKKSTNAQSFCPYMSLHLSLKDLNSPISHLVLKYCKFISESGRCLNNQDTSLIIGLITDVEKT